MKAIITLLTLVISVSAHSTDFKQIHSINDVKVKKQEFFNHLADFVHKENENIISERSFLLSCDQECQSEEKYSIIANKYKEQDKTKLLEKVDIIPMDLALNQAANESSWGGSRFSRQANNLFGMWCFSKGCGLVPLGRPSGKTYEVRKYSSIQDSINHYMLTLNTNSAYKGLRDIRARLRERGDEIDAQKLAEGLINYSERREDYIAEIKSMIRVNKTFVDAASIPLVLTAKN